MSIDKKNKGSSILNSSSKKETENSEAVDAVQDLLKQNNDEFLDSVEEEKRMPFSNFLDGQEIAENNESLSFVINSFDKSTSF